MAWNGFSAPAQKPGSGPNMPSGCGYNLDGSMRPLARRTWICWGWRLHPLHRDLAGHWSVTVSGNWRLTFTFEGKDAVLVDYLDYH
jgi:hypothetical protein